MNLICFLFGHQIKVIPYKFVGSSKDSLRVVEYKGVCRRCGAKFPKKNIKHQKRIQIIKDIDDMETKINKKIGELRENV